MAPRSPLVLTYCADGPYRYLRENLATGVRWFPWGYRLGQVSSEAFARVATGESAELWEIDNSRDPQSAKFMTFVRLDFVTRADGYLPLTFFVAPGFPTSESSEVIAGAREGWMVFVTGATHEPGPAIGSNAASNSASILQT